jgi:hypothetical protein
MPHTLLLLPIAKVETHRTKEDGLHEAESCFANEPDQAKNRQKKKEKECIAA